MLNLVPVMKSSLVATGNRTCQRGWVKPFFVASLIWQWATTPNEEHNKRMQSQIDTFSWDLHCDLTALNSLVSVVTGYNLGNNLYSRIVFTATLRDKRYQYWNLISSSKGRGDCNVLNHRLYENPNDPDKFALVFETSSGLFGVAKWDMAQLEIFSEEDFSDVAIREGLYKVQLG